LSFDTHRLIPEGFRLAARPEAARCDLHDELFGLPLRHAAEVAAQRGALAHPLALPEVALPGVDIGLFVVGHAAAGAFAGKLTLAAVADLAVR